MTDTERPKQPATFMRHEREWLPFSQTWTGGHFKDWVCLAGTLSVILLTLGSLVGLVAYSSYRDCEAGGWSIATGCEYGEPM